MKWLAILLVVIVFGVLVGVMFSNYANSDALLRNSITAQQKSNESEFDKVWKVIQQQAGVTEQYKEGFKEIFIAIMAARYQDDGSGSLMKWVQESTPNFDPSLLGKLMTTIEAQRESFNTAQKKLIDLKREHDNLMDLFPGNIIFKMLGRTKIDIAIVTSAKTDAAFKTHQDNDIDLFKKDSTK